MGYAKHLPWAGDPTFATRRQEIHLLRSTLSSPTALDLCVGVFLRTHSFFFFSFFLICGILGLDGVSRGTASGRTFLSVICYAVSILVRDTIIRKSDIQRYESLLPYHGGLCFLLR